MAFRVIGLLVVVAIAILWVGTTTTSEPPCTRIGNMPIAWMCNK